MTTNNPTVSVIIPTYNRAHLIATSILSVLKQSYQDFEIIVVDDSSPDNTGEVVKNFNDKRIKYIRHEKNKGNAAARNTGIKNSHCKYIAFQDDDDEWVPDKLEKQMQLLINSSPQVAAVYSGFWRTEKNKKFYIPSEDIVQKEGNIHAELLKKNFIGTPVVVIKKECFAKTGMFDEKLPRLVDWEMWLRVAKHYNFKYIDTALLISEQQTGGIGANQQILIQALEYILNKHFDDFKKDKKLLARHYFDLAFMLANNNEIKKGQTYFLQAIKFNPLNIKYVLIFPISLLGQTIYNSILNFYEKIFPIKS